MSWFCTTARRWYSSTGSTRRASLSGQVHMVLGSLGPVYQGIVSRLLDARALVLAPSVDLEGLEQLQEALGYPAGLVTVNTSPCSPEGADELSRLIRCELQLRRLDGVVAHGGLVHSHPGHPWESPESGLMQGRSILETPPGEVMRYVESLMRTHVGAAQGLIPLLEQQGPGVSPSYTIVTGGLKDGRKRWMPLGAEGPALTAMYGLGLALRGATTESRVSTAASVLRLKRKKGTAPNANSTTPIINGSFCICPATTPPTGAPRPNGRCGFRWSGSGPCRRLTSGPPGRAVHRIVQNFDDGDRQAACRPGREGWMGR